MNIYTDTALCVECDAPVHEDSIRCEACDNYASHTFGRVDDMIRCIRCEVATWHASEYHC